MYFWLGMQIGNLEIWTRVQIVIRLKVTFSTQISYFKDPCIKVCEPWRLLSEYTQTLGLILEYDPLDGV